MDFKNLFSEVHTYKTLTLETLEETINRIYSTSREPQPLVIYTGMFGKMLFDLTLIESRLGYTYKWNIAIFKNTQGYYISLFSKHGLIKINVKSYNNIDIYIGTKFLVNTNGINEYTIDALHNINYVISKFKFKHKQLN